MIIKEPNKQVDSFAFVLELKTKLCLLTEFHFAVTNIIHLSPLNPFDITRGTNIDNILVNYPSRV